MDRRVPIFVIRGSGYAICYCTKHIQCHLLEVVAFNKSIKLLFELVKCEHLKVVVVSKKIKFLQSVQFS